jgi:hypothetical protein
MKKYREREKERKREIEKESKREKEKERKKARKKERSFNASKRVLRFCRKNCSKSGSSLVHSIKKCKVVKLISKCFSHLIRQR